MRLLLSLAGIGLWLATTASAQSSSLDRALKHVPDDATLVVVIPDVNELAAEIAAFGRAIGSDEPANLDTPELLRMLYPTEMFTELLARPNAVETMLLMLGPDDVAPLAVFTVSDPMLLPAFRLAMELEEATNEQPDEYARIVNGVVIGGATKETVDAAAESKGKLAARLRKELKPLGDDKHALLWIDVPAFRPQLDELLTTAEAIVQMGLAMAGPQAESAAPLWNRALASCRTLAEETRVYAAAARFGADGIYAADLATFTPDGKIADYLKKVRKPPADMLRGLSNERFLLVFGCQWLLPEDVETLGEVVLKVMAGESLTATQPADEERAARFKRAIAASRRLAGYNAALTFDRTAPGLSGGGLYKTRDAQAFLQSIPALIELKTRMAAAAGPGLSIQVARRQETIRAVQADVYTFSFDVEDEQTRDIIHAIYGETLTFCAAPHPDGVLYTMGTAEAAHERMDRLLATEGKLSTHRDVAGALKHLSPNPQACFLADLPPLCRWFMDVAKTAGAPVPQVDLPTETPYAALTFYLEREAVRAELWLPAEPLEALIKAFEYAETRAGGEPM